MDKNDIRNAIIAVGILGGITATAFGVSEKKLTDPVVQESIQKMKKEYDITAPIAVPVEKYTAKEMEEKYGLYGDSVLFCLSSKANKYSDTINYDDVIKENEFYEDNIYYRYPAYYEVYQVDDSYEMPGMVGVYEASKNNELSYDYTVVHFQNNDERSLDGTVAVYYPYYAALKARDDLLSQDKELTEEEQKIVDKANEIEQVAIEVYQNQNKSNENEEIERQSR